MYKKEKYNGQPSFQFYNLNPKNKITDDCVIRSIAAAEGRKWDDVLLDLTHCAIQTGYITTAVENYSYYLKHHGWAKCKIPKNTNGKRYKAYEFAKIYDGCCLAHVGKYHMSYLSDHTWYDVWDCTNGDVGNYWEYIGVKK